MLGVGIGGGVSLAFAFASTRGGGDSDLLVEETLESAAREHLGVAVANALASRVVRVDGARAEEFCARAKGDDARGGSSRASSATTEARTVCARPAPGASDRADSGREASAASYAEMDAEAM